MNEQISDALNTPNPPDLPFSGGMTFTLASGLVRGKNEVGQVFIPYLVSAPSFRVSFELTDGHQLARHAGTSVIQMTDYSPHGIDTGHIVGDGVAVGVGAGYLQITAKGLYISIMVHPFWARFSDGNVDHDDSILIAMKEYDLHTVTVLPYGETEPVEGTFYADNKWLDVFTEQGVAESDEKKKMPRNSIEYLGLTLYEIGGSGSSKRLMRVTRDAPLGQIPAVFVCKDGRKGLVNLQKI